jgi:2'-5' RNA ligase
MRLFVAVELAEDVRRAAEQAARALQRQLDTALRARWVSSENMHLTVRFIGHVPDDRAPFVLDALRPPLRVDPFDVALGGAGAFPSHGPPRVVWIGLKDGLPSLTAIHEELNARLRPLGFAPEDRPFSAHLTLARVKDVVKGSAAAVRGTIREADVSPARCRVNHATVFESRLSPRGSTYSQRLRIPLASTSA